MIVRNYKMLIIYINNYNFKIITALIRIFQSHIGNLTTIHSKFDLDTYINFSKIFLQNYI